MYTVGIDKFIDSSNRVYRISLEWDDELGDMRSDYVYLGMIKVLGDGECLAVVDEGNILTEDERMELCEKMYQEWEYMLELPF